MLLGHKEVPRSRNDGTNESDCMGSFHRDGADELTGELFKWMKGVDAPAGHTPVPMLRSLRFDFD